MTRPIQKTSERATLDVVLAAVGLRLDQEPVAGETPDFTLSVSGRKIGVEITMYRSGDGSGRRQVESEWDKLKIASDAFRNQHPELRDINVGLMFKDTVPPRRRHTEFMQEIAAFIRAQRGDLESHDVEYWPPSFPSALMREYLRTVYLRVDRFAVWHSNLAGGFVARPDSTIAEIVAEKAQKNFRPTDELWLAIQCSVRISEMVSTILGVVDFEAVPSLDAFPFERVFLLAFNGAYQWKRGEAWSLLTGSTAA